MREACGCGVGKLSGEGESGVDEDGMVGWSSSCPLQHLRRMFVLAGLINNWQKGRVADNWLPAENKNIIDPHTLMITERQQMDPALSVCVCKYYEIQKRRKLGWVTTSAKF